MKSIFFISLLCFSLFAKGQSTFENIYANPIGTKFAYDVIQKADSTYLVLGLDFTPDLGHLISVSENGNITADYTTWNIYSAAPYSFDTTKGGNILYWSSISNTFTFCNSTGSVFIYTNIPSFTNSFLSPKKDNYLFFRPSVADTIKIVEVDTLATILNEINILPVGISSYYPNRVLWSNDSRYILGLFTFNSAHARGISIMATDTIGSIVWQTTFNDTLSLQTLTTTSDSGVIIAGNCWDTTANSATNIFYLKLDKNGGLQWYKRSPHLEFIWAYVALFETADGGYIIGKSEYIPNRGDDIVMIKLDSSGNEQWSKSFGRTMNDLLGSITETLDHGFIISGCSYDTSYIGHYYLIKTDSLGNFTGTNNIDNLYSHNLSDDIFPNPFTDKLNIKLKENLETEIILYDVFSRKLLQNTFSNSITLNTERLAKGLYFYEVRRKNGIVQNGKILKE